jgi:hypothetical protein
MATKTYNESTATYNDALVDYNGALLGIDIPKIQKVFPTEIKIQTVSPPEKLPSLKTHL